MIAKKFFLIGLLFLFPLSLLGQNTGDTKKAIPLSWKFKKDEKIRYHQLSQFNVQMNTSEGGQTMQMVMEGILLLHVKDVDSDGRARIEQKYDWIRIDIESSTGQKMTFDSRKKEDREKAKTNQRMMALASLTKITFLLEIKGSGNIDKMEVQMDIPGRGKVTKPVESKGSTQDAYVVFPKALLSPGETWQRDSLLEMIGMPIKRNTRYTFKKVDVYTNEDCALLETQIDFTPKNYSKPNSEEPDAEKDHTQGKGRVVFSLERGRVLLEEFKARLQFNNPETKYGKVKMRMDLDYKYTLKE